MLTSILNFFGFPRKKKNASNDEIKKMIDSSFNDFTNRPIYKELTVDIIDKTTDDELVQTVFDNLSEKLPDDYTKEYDAVLNFSKPRQAIYLIWILEAEVSNGGFNQYYANPSGQFAHITPRALSLVGVDMIADLVKKANTIYANENARITEHQDGTLEGFSESYKNNPLNDLDSEFYDLSEKENLSKLQIDFIRSNKTLFADK